jgi:hypothetical protein
MFETQFFWGASFSRGTQSFQTFLEAACEPIDGDLQGRIEPSFQMTKHLIPSYQYTSPGPRRSIRPTTFSIAANSASSASLNCPPLDRRLQHPRGDWPRLVNHKGRNEKDTFMSLPSAVCGRLCRPEYPSVRQESAHCQPSLHFLGGDKLRPRDRARPRR